MDAYEACDTRCTAHWPHTRAHSSCSAVSRRCCADACCSPRTCARPRRTRARARGASAPLPPSSLSLLNTRVVFALLCTHYGGLCTLSRGRRSWCAGVCGANRHPYTAVVRADRGAALGPGAGCRGFSGPAHHLGRVASGTGRRWALAGGGGAPCLLPAHRESERGGSTASGRGRVGPRLEPLRAAPKGHTPAASKRASACLAPRRCETPCCCGWEGAAMVRRATGPGPGRGGWPPARLRRAKPHWLRLRRRPYPQQRRFPGEGQRARAPPARRRCAAVAIVRHHTRAPTTRHVCTHQQLRAARVQPAFLLNSRRRLPQCLNTAYRSLHCRPGRQTLPAACKAAPGHRQARAAPAPLPTCI